MFVVLSHISAWDIVSAEKTMMIHSLKLNEEKLEMVIGEKGKVATIHPTEDRENHLGYLITQMTVNML